MALPLMLLLAVAAFAQQPPEEHPVFHGGVALVRVDALVTGRGGHPIPDLTVSDFLVFDEGQPQKIVFFGHETEPIDLLLLLDISGSMHRHLEELAATTRAALKSLAAGDRVAVMLFAREAALREPFTEDYGAVQEEIRDAVRSSGLGSGTAINSAIVNAAGHMRTQPPRGRRAVLIITDNLSLNYKVPDEDVIRALWRADTVLNAILIGRQKRPDPPRPGYTNPDFTPSDVFKLADATGGEAMEARKVGESFQLMIERIRSRYGIDYQAPQASPGQFRQVRVELAPAARRRYGGAAIRARTGYNAAP